METTHTVKLGESWSADRVLDDDMRARLKATLRSLFSTTDPTQELRQLGDGLPLDVDQINVLYHSDYTVRINLYHGHPEDVTLVCDEVVGCSDHEQGNTLSRLAQLGEDYADLETDLLEVLALMADLPEFADERERYVVGDFALSSLTCYEGSTMFCVTCFVDEPTRSVYQDADFELGRRIGLPVEPRADDMLDN